MKSLMLILAALLINVSVYAQAGCNAAKEEKALSLSKPNKEGGYGKIIKTKGAVNVSEIPAKMASAKELELSIRGKVSDVCQKKGCWMETELGNGQSMRIRFKDYAFFVPMNCAGKEFVAQGKASWYETSVSSLRHYAEDAGKTKEEIEAITEPKKELIFIAEGVIFP